MIKKISFRELLKKDSTTICLSIGGFYTIMGIFALLIIKLQKLQTISFSNFPTSPDASFMNLVNELHDIWTIYMPLMIVLGLGYLAFGFFFNKLKTNKYKINLLLSILCLIWGIAYCNACIEYLDIFLAVMPNNIAISKYIIYATAGIGCITVLAVMTVPQYIIGKRIKEQENEDEQ